MKLKEQSGKVESCQEDLWNETQLKGPQRQKYIQKHNTKEWASSVGLCQKQTATSPPCDGETAGTAIDANQLTLHWNFYLSLP